MESDEGRTSEYATPAPYGTTCTNCARAKYKCIYRGNDGVCERCHRLKRDCQPSTSVRKRNVVKPVVRKRNHLEDKIDDLAYLVRSQSKNKRNRNASPSRNEDGSVVQARSTSPESSTSVVVDPTTGWARFDQEPDDGLSTSLRRHASTVNISDDQSNKQLTTFCSTFLPFFPCVHIPTHITAVDLRSYRPFLWLVIMSVTTKSAVQQLALGDLIDRIIAEKLIMEHEKDLDLLQGLICYVAWCQYHKKNRSSLVVWSQLAVSLAVELDLYRSLAKGSVQNLSKRRPTLRLPIQQPRTIEERRTFLATFILSSMIWTAQRKMEPVAWTPYLDECARILSEGEETDSDILLAAHSRFYYLIDQVTRPATELATDGQLSETYRPSLTRATQIQLNNIIQNLPISLKTDKSILLYSYGTQMIARENLISGPIGHHASTDLPDFHRLEALDALLTAIEQWFIVFYEMPIADWVGLPFSIFAQFGKGVMLLFKLNTFNEPGWDKDEVKRRADPLEMLDRVAVRLESLPEVIGMEDTGEIKDGGLFFKSARLLQGLKAIFVAEMTPTTTPSQTHAGSSVLDSIETTPATAVPDDILLSVADDPWLADLFATWWDF